MTVQKSNSLSTVDAVGAKVAAHDTRPFASLSGTVCPSCRRGGADFEAGDGSLLKAKLSRARRCQGQERQETEYEEGLHYGC